MMDCSTSTCDVGISQSRLPKTYCSEVELAGSEVREI